MPKKLLLENYFAFDIKFKLLNIYLIKNNNKIMWKIIFSYLTIFNILQFIYPFLIEFNIK